MRTAAARVGLGLAAASARKTINGGSSLSLYMRRSSSLAAAAENVGKKKVVDDMKSGSESEMDLELNRGKSIYLCFSEMSYCGDVRYVNHVVRPIGLDSDESDDDVKEEKEGYLQVAAYKRCKVNRGWGPCSRFGSQILFPIGPARVTDMTDISCIDTSTRPLKFQKTKFKGFSSPKYKPLLRELNGKLYCLSREPLYCPSRDPFSGFEVLDPENDPKWRPLERPPFIDPSLPKTTCFYASFFEGSNKIIGWARQETGVYCFDADKPENGWKESSFSLGNTLPFLNYNYYRPPTFIPNHHPDLGNFHLLFTYDPYNAPLLVNAYFMSDNCESFKPIKANPIQLPELCYKYNVESCDFTPHSEYDFEPPLDPDYEPPIFTDFEFVHLGAQKVGLVLNKFFPFDHVHVQRRNTGILLLVTFEYDIITTDEDSKSTVEIQTRLLGTRRFRYRSRKLRKPHCTKTQIVDLTGAFML